MQYLIKKYRFLIPVVFIVFLNINYTRAQSVYQPYSYQFYQKFNADLYSVKTNFHSSIKPYQVDDSLLKHAYDSLMQTGPAIRGDEVTMQKHLELLNSFPHLKNIYELMSKSISDFRR